MWGGSRSAPKYGFTDACSKLHRQKSLMLWFCKNIFISFFAGGATEFTRVIETHKKVCKSMLQKNV